MRVFSTLAPQMGALDTGAFANSAIYEAKNHFGGQKDASQIQAISAAIDAGQTAEITTGTSSGTKAYFESSLGISSVRLSDESISKLKEHFSADDFHKRDDGSVILSGEAERYVSGWFDDIANARGYAAANDTNSERLSDAQMMKLQDGVKAHIDSSGKVTSMQTYTAFKDFSLGAKGARNINEAMDESIFEDADFNGKITLDEFVKSRIALGEAAQTTANAPHIATAGGGFDTGDWQMDELIRMNKEAVGITKTGIEKMHQEEVERAQAAAKLAELKQAVKAGQKISDEDAKLLESIGLKVSDLKDKDEQNEQAISISEPSSATKPQEQAQKLSDMDKSIISDINAAEHLVDKLV